MSENTLNIVAWQSFEDDTMQQIRVSYDNRLIGVAI